MANEVKIFRKFVHMDQVGRQLNFDMDRPEYRGKMYVDAAEYGILPGDRLTPEEADPEIVSAYVCKGLKGVGLHLAMRNFENIDRNGWEAGYDMDSPNVRKNVVRALVGYVAENQGSEPDTENIRWMNTYISEGLEGVRKALSKNNE